MFLINRENANSQNERFFSTMCKSSTKTCRGKLHHGMGRVEEVEGIQRVGAAAAPYDREHEPEKH